MFSEALMSCVGLTLSFHDARTMASLDFVVNRFFVKLFKTTDMQVAKMCREHFDFVLPGLQLDRRRRSFVGFPVTTDLVKFLMFYML